MHKYIIAISILGAILSSACSEQTIYSSCTEGMVICDGNRRLECINSNGATEWQTVEECAVGCFADVGRTFCSVFDSNGIQQESYLCKDGYLHKYDIIDSKSGKKTEFVFECPNKTCKDTTNCECNPELSCLDGCQSDGSCKPKEGCAYGNNDNGSCKRADGCVAGYEDNGTCKPLDCYIGNEDDGSCIKAIGCPLDSKGNELIGLDGACLDCKSGIITDGDEKGKCERLEGCKLGWAPDGSCIQAASCLLGYQDDGTCKGCANGVGSDGQCIRSQNCKIQDRWNDDGSCINKLGCVISKMTEDGGLTFWDDKGDCLHANCIQAVEPNDNGTCPCNNAEACFDDGALIDERTMNCSFNEVVDKNSVYKDNYNASEQCRIYEACADGQCYCELNHEFYVNGEYYCTNAANCGRCKRIDSNGNHMYDWYESKELLKKYQKEVFENEQNSQCWNYKTGADNTTINRNQFCIERATDLSDDKKSLAFCDSAIDYHCATKCTSNEQCMKGFICRKTDGRCAADSFTTVWSNQLRNSQLQIGASTVDAYVCWDWNEDTSKCDDPVSENSEPDCNSETEQVRLTACKMGFEHIQDTIEITENNRHHNGFSHNYKTNEPTDNSSDVTVKIIGTLDGFYIIDDLVRSKLKKVSSFGSVGISVYESNIPPGYKRGGFELCEELTSISSIDIPDSSKLDMRRMFQEAYQFNDQIERWDVSNITSMEKLFFSSDQTGFKQLVFNQPLNKWDVSNVRNMKNTLGYTNFNQSLDNWNVSNVTTMEGLFGHSSFNKPLNNWAHLLSKVTCFRHMFYDAKNFNQDLSSWEVNLEVNLPNNDPYHSMFKVSGLILDYNSPDGENNLCKIYKSSTWINIDKEIDSMFSGGISCP